MVAGSCLLDLSPFLDLGDVKVDRRPCGMLDASLQPLSIVAVVEVRVKPLGLGVSRYRSEFHTVAVAATRHEVLRNDRQQSARPLRQIVIERADRQLTAIGIDAVRGRKLYLIVSPATVSRVADDNYFCRSRLSFLPVSGITIDPTVGPMPVRQKIPQRG
jgi:hypothetical protein